MDVHIRTPIIAVPARNEEERLPGLFASLAAQCWQAEHGKSLSIVIVLNNCTDNSRSVVQDAIARYSSLNIQLHDTTFEPCNAHVGSARRLAMEKALALCANPTQYAILTTDADATPRADWVSANLRHLGDGIDLVGGLIIGNPDEEEKLGPLFNLRASLHKRYSCVVDYFTALIAPLPYDPWPRHHDNTGGSLAIKADVYHAIGGLPPVPFREDIALVECVRRAGYLIRHPLDVVVEVSARLQGRASGGMADCLTTWMHEAATGEPLLVEHPEKIMERIAQKNQTSGNLTDDSEHTITAEKAIEMLVAMIAHAGGDPYAI